MDEDQTDNRPVVLIIDDDKSWAHMLAANLTSVGYNVVLAIDGESGLTTATTQHPKLIVLDYRLPDTDGMTILRKLRRDEWGKDVPVVFSTNLYDVDAVNDALELNVPDYILKTDVSLDEIVKLVGKYLPLDQQ